MIQIREVVQILDLNRLLSFARDDARLSHPNPVCQAASGDLVAAITTAVSGGDQEAMLAAAEKAAQEPEAQLVRDRLALARLGHGPDGHFIMRSATSNWQAN
jgi:hypothetical protein